MGGDYTPGEVAWLLHLTRGTAIAFDADPKDSTSDLSEDPNGGGSSAAEVQLPVIARWWDVQGAATAISLDKVHGEVAGLRGRGYTEDEIARMTGLARATVHRRFRATLAELLLALGGPADRDDHDRVSRIPACMVCATRPRCRITARRFTTRDADLQTRWVTQVSAERQASLCAECLPPALRPYLAAAAKDAGEAA